MAGRKWAALGGLLAVLAWSAAQASNIGVLILAHGGSEQWNQMVRHCVEAANLSCPYEVVLGMGDSDSTPYQTALRNLHSHGAQKIVTIPLLISSHSEVYRQYEFLLRLRSDPGFPHPMMMAMPGHDSMPAGASQHPAVPLDLGGPVVLTAALDSSPFMAQMLLERALEISREPGKEILVLVAHGPNDDHDNLLWQKSLDGWAATLEQRGGFAAVKALTLRDDAPDAVRDQATGQLRRLVQEARSRGQAAIIVPVLMASGGIEGHISKRLEGLPYRMGRPLLPHPKVSEWIRDQVDRAASEGGV